MQNRNSFQDLLKEREFITQLFVLIIATIILMTVAFLFGEKNFWDDAYITFRYSQNLANGYGITWNIQDAPTQGSTTLSFILLIAAGIKLGLPVELTAFVLNILGLIFIVVSLHFSYRLIFDDKSLLAILPVFVILTYPGTVELITSGMESVFWTGVLYATLLILMIYRETRQKWSLILFFILSYIACLTRPESALIIGLWFLYLIGITTGKERLHIIAGIGVFGAGGILYVIWLNSYFGYVFPNSFYIKVESGLNKEGIEYVLSFIIFFLLKPISIISLTGILFLLRREKVCWIPHLAFFILLPFYLFTEPLTGVAFRFLHPASLLVLFLFASAGLYHFRLIRQNIQQSGNPFIQKITSPLSSGIVLLTIGFFLFSFFMSSINYYRNLSPENQKPDSTLWQIAHLLADVPDIENSSIIYGDAGIVAYETMAYYIDPVGLNHSAIAREAPERGGEWVVELLMEYDADLMVFYSYWDGRIFNRGHGVIGTYYSDLYLHPEFQDNYVEIAAIDYDFVLSRWFARIDSPYLEAFDLALEPLDMANPPAIIP